MPLNEVACVKRTVSVPRVGLQDALSRPSCGYDALDEVEQPLCFSKAAAMLKDFSLHGECAVPRVCTSWWVNPKCLQTPEACKEQES